jgi:hypothetical protein
MIETLAQSILAEHGMSGRLSRIGGDRFQFRGEINGKGCAVEIEGEPDETLLREAAPMMRDSIASEWR